MTGAHVPQLSEATCCCGHPRSAHEHCSDLYPAVCMEPKPGFVPGPDSHPFDGVCSCLCFEDEETVY